MSSYTMNLVLKPSLTIHCNNVPSEKVLNSFIYVVIPKGALKLFQNLNSSLNNHYN